MHGAAIDLARRYLAEPDGDFNPIAIAEQAQGVLVEPDRVLAGGVEAGERAGPNPSTSSMATSARPAFTPCP